MAFHVDGQRVVVAGAGRSGRAAARLLVSRGASVTLADRAATIDEQDVLAGLGVALALGPHQPALFAEADLVVVSPGVPLDQTALRAAREAGVPIIGELELASRWLSGRIVAITGTKGKSTTTTLAARMLQEAGLAALAGGNLGPALSAQVDQSAPDVVHVVEVSSFQLQTTDTFHPWIAVLLNLSPDHLDHHASFDEYRGAKARIFANQGPADWAVVNADDPAALELARGGRARRFDFAYDSRTLACGVAIDGPDIVRRSDGRSVPIMPTTSVQLAGRHLLGDVLAASAVGCIASLPTDAMRRAVEGFAGLEHAFERVATVAGVVFVNDSKATNVIAARRALEAIDPGAVVIMGGRFKGGAFEDLRDLVAARVRAVVAIGEARPLIEQALASVVPVTRAETMAEAVDQAFGLARPRGTVLLAPACSSFDMFRDYADRGRAFKDAVRKVDEEL